jgi:hypothetical protein
VRNLSPLSQIPCVRVWHSHSWLCSWVFLFPHLCVLCTLGGEMPINQPSFNVRASSFLLIADNFFSPFPQNHHSFLDNPSPRGLFLTSE